MHTQFEYGSEVGWILADHTLPFYVKFEND